MGTSTTGPRSPSRWATASRATCCLDDPVLRDLHGEVAAVVGPRPVTAVSLTGKVICPRLRFDGRLVRTITVVARFESVADVTLDEVRVELVSSEDSASDELFRSHVDGR